MKTWIKYAIIFGLIGLVIGYFYGFNYYAPTCPIDEATGMITECMGDPYIYGQFFGIIEAVIGIIIGLIFSRFKR